MSEFKPVKLAYDVYEPANGNDGRLPPVIFMHGVTGNKENFKDIAQIIVDETGRKGYAFDARNHGDSEHSDLFSFDLNVDDLFHFMDTVNISKAVLIGQSMGGLTANRAALRKPERVEMVFVEDMFVKKCPKELIAYVGGFIQMFLGCVSKIPKELDPDEAVKFVVDLLFSQLPPGTPVPCEKEKLYDAGMVLSRNADGKYDVKFNKSVILKAVANSEELLSDPVGQYDGPAYFIYGSTSPFCVGKEEEHIKSFFPKAELIEVVGANHNVKMGCPEKYLQIVLQKLKS